MKYAIRNHSQSDSITYFCEEYVDLKKKWEELQVDAPHDDIRIYAEALMAFQQAETAVVRNPVQEQAEAATCKIAKTSDLAPTKGPEGPHWSRPDYTPMELPATRSNNDCPIVAVSNIFEMPYSESKGLCFQYGWSSTSGLQRGFMELLADRRKVKSFYRPDLCGRRLDDFIDRAPAEGVYLCYVDGHVFTCIQGCIVNPDLSRGWQDVREVYELLPEDICAEVDVVA